MIFFFEMRKCIFNKKSLIVLIFGIVLKLIFSFASVENEDINIISDRDFYMEQYGILRGKYSKENEEYITKLRDSVSVAESEMSLLYGKLLGKEISSNDFLAQTAELNEAVKHKSSINTLYEKYLYVKADSDKRVFGLFNGWERIFLDKTPDFILIIELIFISLSVFWTEYNSGTRDLLLTTENGKTRLALIKFGCCGIFAFFCTVIFSACQFWGVFSSFPVENMNVAVQSIESFNVFSKELSILQLYLLMLILRSVGSLVIMTVTCLLSQLFRKAVPTTIASLMIILLPIFLVPEKDLYALPLPISLLSGNGVAAIDKTVYDNVVTYEMSSGQITAMLLISLFYGLLFFTLTVVLYCRREK